MLTTFRLDAYMAAGVASLRLGAKGVKRIGASRSLGGNIISYF